MNGLLGPVTANRNMLAQALNSRNKPEFQMKQNTPQGLLDAAALATSPVPIAGDMVGLLADGHRFATQPETRTPLNFGLAALGLLPLIPAAGAAAGLWRGSAGPAMGGNQLGMINIEGRGRFPQTSKDVDTLAKKLEKMLFDQNIHAGRQDSSISPSTYFYLRRADGADDLKVRISDHMNVHGADVSIDPSGQGKSFEEAISFLNKEGFPVGNKATKRKDILKLDYSDLDSFLGKRSNGLPHSEETLKKWQKQFVKTIDGKLIRKPGSWP